MKPTLHAYLSTDTSFELCPSCKHKDVSAAEEPCKSCVISNFEPFDDPALNNSKPMEAKK